MRTIPLAICLLLLGCSGDDPDPLDARVDTSGSDTGAPPDGSTDGASAPCRGPVLVGEVTNARGLGGHPLSGGASFACGKVFRGGDLAGLTSAGCAELADLGVEMVIDLRERSVQQSEPAAECVKNQVRLTAASMPRLLPDNPANYLALLEEKDAVAKIFSALGDAASYPLYVHCVIGRDRASFAAALILLAAGASKSTVVDEFNLSAAQSVAVKQPCIEAVVDEIDSRGGIDAYLTSTGVTAAQLETLRKQLRR